METSFDYFYFNIFWFLMARTAKTSLGIQESLTFLFFEGKLKGKKDRKETKKATTKKETKKQL